MLRSINPRTGETIAEFTSTTASQLRAVEARGRRCQKRWLSKTSPRERIAAIRALESVCRRRMDEVVRLMHEEIGVPVKALRGAYNSVLAGVEHYIGEYERMQDAALDTPSGWTDTSLRLSFLPHGLVGHIGVWNFPFWQTMITAIPALLTGNGVVYKPSELSTSSGLTIAELVHEAGYPPSLYQAVVGGPDVGQMMVTSDLDALAFTGGIRTGLEITRNAGIRPLILELSGNDAAVVCADADIEQTARGIAYGTFCRAGQVCIRIKRVYVHEEVAEPFIDRLTEIATGLNVEEDIGPLIRAEARERVARAVQDAVRGGAELLCGGRAVPGPGFYYHPTVLRHRNDSLGVVHHETFGPVCPVRVVGDEREAIALANDSHYGLGATVWTRDLERGEAIARQLEVGTVWINDCIRTLPGGEYFQGWKQSSIPSSMSRLQMFTKKQVTIMNLSHGAKAHWFG